ncbi:hypothetical protein ABZ208_19625 [Streptomyces sp. NPDC006208]|uniref:hypothetical protein n=1 Tax=Streptomyces sp. NPDC006208 TaxID=3156734 RepID=UPI0033A4C3D1
MNTKTVRHMYVTAAVAVAFASITSCNGSGGEQDSKQDRGAGVVKVDPIAALRSVQAKTKGADSARVEGTTVMGDAMSMKQSGAIAWTDGLTGTIEITYTGGTMADSLKQAGVNGPIEARYFKEGYVVNMGAATAQQSGGKHWISYDYDDLAEVAGAAGEVMKDQLQNTTPDQGVKSLLASGDVKKVGREDVRGVTATHYSGTVDVAELSAKNSSLDADQLAQLKKQLSDAGITTEKVDIWVDDNDLLVKKVERGQMKTGEFNSTVFYSDYGTKVSAERPAASDTVDFRELMQKGTS